MSTLSEELRSLREAEGLTQGALGKRISLPQSHISLIEKGKVDPRLSSVVEMARSLGHEVMLIPKALVPAVEALLSGKSEKPLWSVDSDEGEPHPEGDRSGEDWEP